MRDRLRTPIDSPPAARCRSRAGAHLHELSFEQVGMQVLEIGVGGDQGRLGRPGRGGDAQIVLAMLRAPSGCLNEA